MADTGTKATTMVDGLTQIMSILGKMKLAPDADQQFIDDLGHVIVAKATQGQAGGMPGQGQGPGAPSGPGGAAPSPVAGPGGGAAPMPGGPGGMPQPGGAGPMGPAGPQPGPQPGAAPPGQGGMDRPGGMTDPDEIRRMLATRTGS